ncbi:relaxase/mobilization nuclease domain-containing protein [Sulfitobacter pontiacus]|uniref:relaxase/mobilization nuclease domain-containing protein n=1 Tax=Sulfitobacter pontiacus TaxID=60137 RepID=UPI0030EB7C13
MAIAKISRPHRAGSTVRYLVSPRDHAGRPRETVSVVASTIGRAPDTAVKFLNQVGKLRPRLERHLYHAAISVPQTDRELSQNDWAAIGRSWCAGMGIENYMIVLHDAHIHILGSRIRLDGTVAPDKNDYRRSELLLRKIEAEFNLARTTSSHLVDKARRSSHWRARSMKELHAVEKDGHSNKDFIRAAIDEALAKEPDETSMRASLAEAGIDMTIGQTADGAPYVLFGFHGRQYGPRSLGQGYSLTSLMEKGLQLSGPQTATAPILVPPWALDAPPETKQPQRSHNHDEAVRRLRGVGQTALEAIERYRIAKRAKNGPPGPDRYDAGPLPDDEPPDVT